MKHLKHIFESGIASAVPMDIEKLQDIKDILLELSDVGFYANITILSRLLTKIFTITIDSDKSDELGGPMPFNYRDVDDVIMRLFKYFEINDITVHSFRYNDNKGYKHASTKEEEIDEMIGDIYNENTKIEIIRIFISKQK